MSHRDLLVVGVANATGWKETRNRQRVIETCWWWVRLVLWVERQEEPPMSRKDSLVVGEGGGINGGEEKGPPTSRRDSLVVGDGAISGWKGRRNHQRVIETRWS